MVETPSHKRAKGHAAGKSGRTELPIKGNRRLDAATKKTATEVERSGSRPALERAARRLRASGRQQKVLQVPQKDLPKAMDVMKKIGVKGSVKNMGGTKRRSV